jgi:hypothetical protein
MSKSVGVIPEETIERRICVIRDQKVMLDHDLAELYGVSTKALNQAVSRNTDRFPEDFMFRLSRKELEALHQSQIVTGSQKHRDPRYPPRAFTQEGIAMLSSVLRSKQAIQVNIAIMRAFVRMREAMASHKELARRIDEIEQKYDARFRAVFDAIRKLMEPPPVPPKRPIGYIHNE